jgi:outer membrane protein assembly factor BamB
VSNGPGRKGWVQLAALVVVAAVGSCGGQDAGDSPTDPLPNDSTLSPRLLYSFSPGTIGFYYGPPTLVGDAIYIGTSRGINYPPGTTNAFYKISTRLTKVWEYPLGRLEVRGGAALDGAGNIYFAAEEGRVVGTSNPSVFWLYSLSPSGGLRWTRQIRRVLPVYGMNNPAIGGDNTIYIGGEKFYALDTDGNEKWSWSTSRAELIMNAPIIDDSGNIYYSGQDAVRSLTVAGTLRWSVPTSGEYFSSPAFSRDETRVFVAVQDTVFCLSASDGARVWAFSPPGIVGVFRATPAVDDEDNVYLGTKADSASVLYAIRADGGGLRWQARIGADLYSSPAIGNDRTLYVGSEYAKGMDLHAIDMETGLTKWSAPLHGDATWSSPALADDGTLYIASIDVNGVGAGLYAFRTESTGLLRNAGSPRFHEGNANTGRRD